MKLIKMGDKKENGTSFFVLDGGVKKKCNYYFISWDFFKLVVGRLYLIPKMQYIDNVIGSETAIYKMKLNGVEIHAMYKVMIGTDLWIEDKRKNSEQVTDLIHELFEEARTKNKTLKKSFPNMIWKWIFIKILLMK